MTNAPIAASTPGTPLRLWPGVTAVVVQWLAWLGLSLVVPEAGPWGMIIAVTAGLAVLLWWLFLSRAPWSERVGVLVLIVVAVAATKRIVHESIAGGGMGMLIYFYAVPLVSLALVAGAALGRRLSSGPRRAAIAGAILIPCGALTLLRTGGITGDGDSDLHWRWSETPEERLLRAHDEPASPSAPAETSTAAAWPGFRGPERDGVVRGVRIETDWSKSPPHELWRRPVGPGWSSFAVEGGLVYTQEQRGEQELVSCYRLATGEPVWRHADPVRFWESNAGAGPRGTPALDRGRVYSLGGTGIVNALDAGTGELAWSRDAAKDTGEKVPEWGFAGSPLVLDDLVIVAASGRLVAYEAATGEQRWLGATGGMGYSSPHLVTLDGVAQILLLAGGNVASVDPSGGAKLWEHAWESGASIVQPALTAEGDVLVSGCGPMGGIGVRRLAAKHGSESWTVTERWTSRGLRPYFNDFVVHAGHAYGFDDGLLACIDLTDGARKWKGGRYGSGQLVLLADEDVLLVLSEEGELALVAAKPEEFTELARFPALAGKTWNHPVLAGDVLLVRNAEEMAAFRLSMDGR